MSNGDYLKKMGAKIKKAREANGLYLWQLSDMCKINKGAINEIELGKRNSHILTLRNIADKLGVDVKDFL